MKTTKLGVRPKEDTYVLVDITDAKDLNTDGEELITGDKDELIILASYLNNKLREQEMMIYTGARTIEFLQKIIESALTEKLSQIDNMYALKQIMTQTADTLGQIMNTIEQQHKGANDDTWYYFQWSIIRGVTCWLASRRLARSMLHM